MRDDGGAALSGGACIGVHRPIRVEVAFIRIKEATG